jgi:hypothetical protein
MNAKQREQYWRKFQLIRNDIEKKYINSIQKSIFAQFEGFAKDIEKIGVDASISKLGLNLWEKDLIKVFEAMYKESVVTFGNAVYRALKIEAKQKAETFGFNAQWTKEILDFLMVKGFTLVSGITQTTKKRLIDIANAGVQEGLSVDDIVKLVLDDKELEYSNMRARRIVRTEVMRGSNIGAMKGAEAHGFQVDKQWISARDSRTRRIPDDEFDHVELDGVIVPFDEPFTSNGKKGEAVVAMQPGDISAPAGFTINCRCTVGFIPKRDANGRLVMKPKLNVPSINQQPTFINPIEVPVETQATNTFTIGKNNRETVKNLQKYIKDVTGLNVSSITVSKDLPVDELNAKANQLAKLFNEYKINPSYDTNEDVKLSFASTKRFLGVVKSRAGMTMSGKVLGKPSLTEMNFGNKNESIQEVSFVPNSEVTRFSSSVDIFNRPISVPTHEFAHVMAISSHVQNPNTPDFIKTYFRELNIIKNEYVQEMLAFNRQGDKKSVYNISLGRYASTNLNEFHAEAFKEYKLSSNPSKYALKVGKLIDKYFKK